jgi:hypothetical protein
MSAMKRSDWYIYLVAVYVGHDKQASEDNHTKLRAGATGIPMWHTVMNCIHVQIGGFEALAEVTMKSTNFWDVAP